MICADRAVFAVSQPPDQWARGIRCDTARCKLGHNAIAIGKPSWGPQEAGGALGPAREKCGEGWADVDLGVTPSDLWV